ncbi:MAG TPA: hypothetical protein VIJ29_01760 [Candidatus Paceibacterota bacterium]
MPDQTNTIAKDRVKDLVLKYKAEVASGGFKKYTEEDIKKGFIEPLFKALGWNIEERNEVSTEESIKSSGRVDYGFYLNDSQHTIDRVRSEDDREIVVFGQYSDDRMFIVDTMEQAGFPTLPVRHLIALGFQAHDPQSSLKM